MGLRMKKLLVLKTKRVVSYQGLKIHQQRVVGRRKRKRMEKMKMKRVSIRRIVSSGTTFLIDLISWKKGNGLNLWNLGKTHARWYSLFGSLGPP